MPPLYTLRVSGPNGAGCGRSIYSPDGLWTDTVRAFGDALRIEALHGDARWPLTYTVVQVSA